MAGTDSKDTAFWGRKETEPEIRFPGKSSAADVIPEEMPGRDGPGEDATDVIPDEMPGQDSPQRDSAAREVRL